MANTPVGFVGRMSPALSPQIPDTISKQSSKLLSGSSIRTPRCLCLIKTDGLTPTYTWVQDSALLTVLSTVNIGDYPNAENASSLSAILQANVPEKYYLSPRACRGILRRASERGKELPEVLRVALERQASV